MALLVLQKWDYKYFSASYFSHYKPPHGNPSKSDNGDINLFCFVFAFTF